MNNQSDYIKIQKIGKGTTGEVYLAKNVKNNYFVALKKIPASFADQPKYQKYIANEIKILKTIKHPYIIQFEKCEKILDDYYLAMEYCNGGTLSSCLEKFKQIYKIPFTERITQHIMKQLVDAVNYLHKNNIIHRDLKLDNILVKFYKTKDLKELLMLNCKIKLIDFGFSTILNNSNDKANTAVGSPLYMAPTIIQKFIGNLDFNTGYTDKCDIWSLGVICYEMLIGKRLFNAESLEELVLKIEKGTYSFPISLSQTAISFISSILKNDEKMRPSAEQLLEHDFLKKDVDSFSSLNLNNAQLNINNNGIQMNTKNENKDILDNNDISYEHKSISSFSVDDPLTNQ